MMLYFSLRHVITLVAIIMSFLSYLFITFEQLWEVDINIAISVCWVSIQLLMRIRTA